jgi:uncharacterized membrane protein YhdT
MDTASLFALLLADRARQNTTSSIWEDHALMFVFLWILASMGVAYAAKLTTRHPFRWFMVAVILSPLVGSVLLWAMNKWNIKLIRPT